MLGIVLHANPLLGARIIANPCRSPVVTASASQRQERSPDSSEISSSRSAKREDLSPWPVRPSGAKKQAHESECGSILICIWNIPLKLKRREFTFLMARIPGVERWDFVSRGPSQESVGYAYCECPTLEDAEETMWLIRSFRVANTKLRANLFDPSRVDWSFSPGKIRASRESRESRENTEEFEQPDSGKLKKVSSGPHAGKKSLARKKRPPPARRVFTRERPPSRRLLRGYANSRPVGVNGHHEETCQ